MFPSLVFRHRRLPLLFLAASVVLVGLSSSADVASATSSSGGGSTNEDAERNRRCTPTERETHPTLCDYWDRHLDEEEPPELLADEIFQWALANNHIVDLKRGNRQNKLQVPLDEQAAEGESSTTMGRSLLRQASTSSSSSSSLGEKSLPVVFAHGMGDSCYNNGMRYITDKVGDALNTFSVCIAIGDNRAEDTKNGYFLNMDASVEVFAKKVKNDQRLAGGFRAIGFSQGNNVIRGYIAKHNDPPIHTFLSVNGVNAGVGAVPYCRPDRAVAAGSSGSSSTTTNRSDSRRLVAPGGSGESGTGRLGNMCELLMEQASKRAYTEFAQEHSFQANYWRDPRPSASAMYREYAQLARWNNEVPDGQPINETLRENWSRTSKFVWVLATEDEMVWPREGEHWAAPDPGDPFGTILPRHETEWYKKDLFGLKTAEEAGKNFYESFVGNHLAFTEDEFDSWIAKYFKA